MSKMTPKNQNFIDDIYTVLCNFNKVGDCFNEGIKVYYDGDVWAKRDYVINATVHNWDSVDSYYLKQRLREVGATNIIGCVRHAIARDYLDWAFDIKKSKLKELGIDN